MSESTAWPSVVNLANSIVGVSVLAMPYCFKELGVVLGPLLLLFCSYLTRKACHSLVKAGSVAKRRTYEFLALHIFGPFGKLAVELCTIGLMLSTCVGFFVIIGDIAPVIVSKILDIPNTASLRVLILVLTAFGVALPLGLLRKLSSLTSVSSLSFAFYFSLVLFLCLQALPNLFSDNWSKGPHKLDYWRPAGILKCFPIFGLAFACQTQIFPIYDTMTDPSLKRMIRVIDAAINMVATIYLSVGFFGIIAFYDRDVAGDILLSFRPSIVGEAIKLGFVLSVAVSFPLVIFPCRLSINSLFWPPPKKGIGETSSSEGVEVVGASYIPPIRFKGITLGIVVSTLIIGINVPGIESILGLVGSTVGVVISFIFPSMLFLLVTSMTHGEYRDKLVAKVVLGVGVAIMLSSTYMNLTEETRKPAVAALQTPLPFKPSPDVLLAPKVAVAVPVPTVMEIRREPPVPHEPDDPEQPAKKDDAGGQEKIPPPVPKLPDKEDYDNLQKKIDAAEEKHDVLLKQLEKQQEQQKIIMEQQNQIIEQLKVNQEPVGGGGGKPKEGAAANAVVGAAGATVAPVLREVEKTRQEIAEANQILSQVAHEAAKVAAGGDVRKRSAVETEEEKKKKEAEEEKKKKEAEAAAENEKKKKAAEMAKKVEEAANYMAKDEEKKKKEAEEKKVEERVKAEAEEEANKQRQKKAAEEEEEAKRRKEEAEKKKKEEEAKAAALIEAAKVAAAEAKKKEEEAHKAAELAVLKVLEAKKAASEAVVKNAIAKDAAKDVAKDAAATAAAADGAGGGGGVVHEKVDAVKAQALDKAKLDVESVDSKKDNGKVAAVAAAASESPTTTVDEKQALKKKLETHEKLIVQMHQKIQDIEKEKEEKAEEEKKVVKVVVDEEETKKKVVQVDVDLGKQQAAAAAAPLRSDGGGGGNNNPKPLGLSASSPPHKDVVQVDEDL